MLSASALYRFAVRQSHKRESYFTVRTRNGDVIAEGIPIGGGQVSAHLSSRVTRTATFTASDEWFPVLESDALSPTQAIVTIEAGIAYPTGERELFPVFTGRIYDADRSRDGEVTFRADDNAADVVEADFEVPVNSQPGASTVAEIERLIRDSLPEAVFGTHDVIDANVPKLSWDDDKGKALDDLATSVEGRWYALGDGSFVVRRYNYEDAPVVVFLQDGPAGSLTSARTRVTADGAYNSVVVLAERLDGGDPIRVVERNLNSVSPYRYGGPFGKRVKKVRMQTAATVADAQRVARSQLAAASALTRQWSLACTPDMTLEPGDVARVRWRGVQDVQVIDTITYPLSPEAPMNISGRSSLTESA